jgi:hypothetical protein
MALTILATLVLCAPAFGYVSGKRVWVKTSGTKVHERWFDAIARAPKGAVYAGGAEYSSAAADYNFLLVKYRADGRVSWTRRWAGPGAADDEIRALASDPSGNVYVAGYSQTGNDTDFVTVKYSAAGKRLWEPRVWTGVAGNYASFAGLAVDSAGNTYVAGTAYAAGPPPFGTGPGGIVVIKYDAGGVEQWVAHYDPDPGDPKAGTIWASDVAIDATGDVYVGGSSMYDSVNQALLLKFSSADGAKLYGQVYDAAVGSSAAAVAVRGTTVAITGWAAQITDADDCLVVTYDLSLNEQHRREYANPAGARDFGDDVAFGPGGTVYVTGYTNRPPPGGSGWYDGCQTIKLAADLSSVVWASVYKPKGRGVEGTDLVVDIAGNAYVAGYMDTDAYEEDIVVVKYSSSAGARKWVSSWRDTGKDDDGPGGIVLGGTRAVYVAGWGAAKGSFERAVAMRINR